MCGHITYWTFRWPLLMGLLEILKNLGPGQCNSSITKSDAGDVIMATWLRQEHYSVSQTPTAPQVSDYLSQSPAVKVPGQQLTCQQSPATCAGERASASKCRFFVTLYHSISQYMSYLKHAIYNLLYNLSNVSTELVMLLK